jgi:hypothetical protein
MTVSPSIPIFQDGPGNRNKTLITPHLTFVDIGWGFSLMVLLKPGFITDGASVPLDIGRSCVIYNQVNEYVQKEYPQISSRYDLESLIEIIIGEPWDMPRLLGACVHDALYSYQWKCRWLCDWIYKRILMQNDYPTIQASVEYYVIRAFGKSHWDAVSDLERDRAREDTEIKIIRTKHIPRVIAEIRERIGKTHL